jgi:hypothetical protein
MNHDPNEVENMEDQNVYQDSESEGGETSEYSTQSSDRDHASLSAFSVPAGFKLVPEDYIAVEPTMYHVMLEALKRNPTGVQQPIHVSVAPPELKPEDNYPVFRIRMLKQFRFGDINYSLARGEEFEYCPGGKYIQIDGEKHTKLRSFLQIWRSQYGPRPDPQARRNPIFQILNTDSCPPLHESMGTTPPRGQYPSEAQRLAAEERRGDATNTKSAQRQRDRDHEADLNYDPTLREHAPRGARSEMQGPEQPQYPQQAAPPYQYPQPPVQQHMTQMGPQMPPRGGLVGSDGLTARARAIKGMSGDMIERAVERQTTPPMIGGYQEPERIEDFTVDPAIVGGGGEIVADIPGNVANEAALMGRQMDMRAHAQANRR